MKPVARVRAFVETAIGLVILAAVYLGAERLVIVTRLPLPAGVVGMLVATAALASGMVPLRLVERGADLLLRWLPLLFVPAAVSVVRRGEALRGAWVPVVVIMVVSTFVVMIAAGLVARRSTGHGDGDGDGGDDRGDRGESQRE